MRSAAASFHPFLRRRAARIVVSALVVSAVAFGAGGVYSVATAIPRASDGGGWPGVLEVLSLLALGVLVLGGVAVGVASVAALLAGSETDRATRERLAALEEAALTDNLTGLRNQRAFEEDLGREIQRRNRTGEPFALLMVDMDGLKQVNDTYGHQAGDARISAVARCLKATVRGADCAYRVGGDEFVLLLPGERAWGALAFAHRLHAATERVGVSVTVGMTESTGAESRGALLRHADLALYEAKRSHRRSVVYSPGLEPPELAPGPVAKRQERLLATALARAVDAKDAGMRNHCETVAELCALIGAELGLDTVEVQKLRLAGLLHDVGKIGIADEILQKPASLAQEELEIVSTHTRIGRNIVAAAGLPQEAEWVLHHHERWDGGGYPAGLQGEEIPLASRIVLVADAFEAITADRPYRPGRSPEQALAEIQANAGSQFDPDCVAALATVVGRPAPAPRARLAPVVAPTDEPATVLAAVPVDGLTTAFFTLSPGSADASQVTLSTCR